MELDIGRGAVRSAATLDDVRVQRALGEIVGARNRASLVAKDVDENVSDPPPLLLGVSDTLERAQESLGRVELRSSALVREPNASTTAVRSPMRKSPVSTNTQTTRGPRALARSAAQTAESTPPDSPHTTRS